MQGQRLDKWLWVARLVRTRTLGARLIEAGKLRVNGERALKPSRSVQSGDVITGAKFGRLFVVRMLGSAEHRASPGIASLLYEDLTPPDRPGEHQGSGKSARSGPRPTKRARRRLDALQPEET